MAKKKGKTLAEVFAAEALHTLENNLLLAEQIVKIDGQFEDPVTGIKITTVPVGGALSPSPSYYHVPGADLEARYAQQIHADATYPLAKALWKSKDGSICPMRSMQDSHVRFAIRSLERGGFFRQKLALLYREDHRRRWAAWRWQEQAEGRKVARYRERFFVIDSAGHQAEVPIAEWARWFEVSRWPKLAAVVSGVQVLTTFVGVGDRERPLALWQTRVLGGVLDGDVKEWRDADAALMAHDALLVQVAQAEQAAAEEKQILAEARAKADAEQAALDAAHKAAAATQAFLDRVDESADRLIVIVPEDENFL